MTTLAARLLYWLAAAFARLPWAWLRALADAVAALWLRLDAREARVARRNLELIGAQWPPAQRAALLREVLRSTARQLLETLRLWTRPHPENLALIREEHGVAAFDAAIAAGQGVIVAAPHHGNWELLNQWLAAHTPLAILYRPPDSAVGEAFLRIVRADRSGHPERGEPKDRVTQVRADGRGVRELFRILKAGGVVGILPDQQPKAGDGVLAPFFGLPTYTMTLLGRLAERSGAAVLFAWCERIDDALGFALHIEPAPSGIGAADAALSTAALNAAVEAIARRDLAQYQWTYKRFRLKPSRDHAENPYRDPRR
jgi:KDO2-lipid IV(A) lauroyltransferase